MSIHHSRRHTLVVAVVLGLLLVALGAMTAAADTTFVVQPIYTTTAVPSNACPGLSVENFSNGWATCDENDTTGPGTVTLVAGPATPPLGSGSAKFTVNDNGNGPYMFTVFQSGLRLDDITQLAYDAYHASGDGQDNRPVLQINVDYDVTDAATNWQGRLIWIPKWAGCVTLADDTWQTFDPTNNAAGCWLQTGTPRVGGAAVAAIYPHTGGTAATWAQILAAYPDAGIHGTYGGVGFKIGSGEGAGVASLDNFKIGVDTGGGPDVTTWDFDPDVACTATCYADVVNGNDLNGGSSAADAKKTIQAAVNAVNAGGQVIVAPGTYPENVTVPKSLALTGAGDDANPSVGTILDGTGLTGKGIFINSGVTGVTIEELRVQNYVLAGSTGIWGDGSNSEFVARNLTVHNNGNGSVAGGGIRLSALGGIDDVLITGNTLSNNTGRGFVIWDGYKTNITITNNTVTGNNCCGIELQDGTASDVMVTGNTVTNQGDSGMAFTGLMAGAGPNYIANNTLTNNGRFGIEIKLPNGTGLTSGDGSIIVEDNTVSRTVAPTDGPQRDHAGIAVIRRGYVAGYNNVDIPTGVVVRSNTVSGYQQPSNSDGFGIVVEGTNMLVTDNTLTNNDVGIQVQAGHLPYTANTNVDGDQNNLADQYFGRGNSPVGCAFIGPNTFSGNGTDTRNVNAGGGIVTNSDTGETFCSIQAAINDAQTLNGHTIQVSAGTYAESVTVNKMLLIKGADPVATIIDPPAGNAFNITASNVTIEDLKIMDAAQGARLSGAIAHIIFDNVHFVNNTSRGIEIQNGATLLIEDVQVLNSLFDNSGTGIRMSSTTRVDGITIDNTTFQNHAGSGFNQANEGSQGWVKNLSVTASTFTNNGTTSGHAGIYAEEFSNVIIEDSTFSGNQYGINLWDNYSGAASVTTNVVIRDNQFTNHKYATIALKSTTSDSSAQLFLVDGNTITQDVSALVGAAQAHLAVTTSSSNPNGAVDVIDNTVTFSGAFPTGILATYGIYLTGGLQDVQVEGNTLDGGNVGTNGATIPTSGIRIVTNVFQTNANIVATKNEITQFVNGVTIHDANNVMGGIQPASIVQVNRNDISGNATYGMQSGAATESDATCNWWGDASGPSGEGPGSGDAVSTYVDFAPWLYSNNLDGDCYTGGTITVVKQTIPDGDTTEFTFNPSWSATNFTLSDGESETSATLPNGTYSVVEENNPTGWNLQSATCTDGVTTVAPNAIPVTADDAWVCTFTNNFDEIGDGNLYIAPNKNNGVVGGVPYMDEDIVVNVLGTNNWAMYFDGSDVGITKNLTDFTFTPDNCLLMTFNGNQNVPGVGLVKPQDLVKFCPTQTGTTTAGTFSLYFDGSDVGLSSSGEIIDAVEVLPNGDLVISTKGSSNIPQPPAAPVKGKKSDLLIFHGTNYGANTTGTWDIYFSNVLVSGLKKENIISLYIENGQDKYLSFWDKYTNVGGVSGDANDILIIHPDNTVTKFWEGSDWGYTGRVHGLHIVPEP